MPLASNPVPMWFQNVALTPADPHNLAVPTGVSDVPAATAGLTMCLGATELFMGGGCQILPTGTGSISGTVVTEGGQPVPNACVFVLAQGLFNVYGPALTGSDGSYVVPDLPFNHNFVVAFVPPFDVGQGPCQSNGPPPAPPAGKLQPVFWNNVWFDLNAYVGPIDPFTTVLQFSPTVVQGSATAIDGCLTTAPADAVPRPGCVAALTPRFTG